MFWSQNQNLSYAKLYNRTKISFVWVYPLMAQIAHFYSELMKVVLSHWCKLKRFKSVLNEFLVYSAKSRQIT